MGFVFLLIAFLLGVLITTLSFIFGLSYACQRKYPCKICRDQGDSSKVEIIRKIYRPAQTEYARISKNRVVVFEYTFHRCNNEHACCKKKKKVLSLHEYNHLPTGVRDFLSAEAQGLFDSAGVHNPVYNTIFDCMAFDAGVYLPSPPSGRWLTIEEHHG